jgi:hypothetical protein
MFSIAKKGIAATGLALLSCLPAYLFAQQPPAPSNTDKYKKQIEIIEQKRDSIVIQIEKEFQKGSDEKIDRYIEKITENLEHLKSDLNKIDDKQLAEDMAEIKDEMRELEQEMREMSKDMKVNIDIRTFENDSTNLDSTVVRMKNKTLKITTVPGKSTFTITDAPDSLNPFNTERELKPVSFNWLGMELGLNILTYENSFSLPKLYDAYSQNIGKSTEFTLRFLEMKVSMINNKLNFVTGLTRTWNNYRFSDPIILSTDGDSLTITMDSISYSKNKLLVGSINMPLMIQFESNPKNPGKSFRISAGGYIGLVTNGKQKRVNLRDGKVKKDDDYQLEPFRYGLTGRIGYSFINLYVNYQLSDLFQSEQGPPFSTVTFGLSLSAF